MTTKKRNQEEEEGEQRNVRKGKEGKVEGIKDPESKTKRKWVKRRSQED